MIQIQHPRGTNESSPGEDTAATAALERFCEHLFAASPDCVKLLDSEGRLLWINAPGCRLMDVADPARLAGSLWVTLWDGEGRAGAEEAVAAARQGQVGRFNGPCATAAGRPKWWDVTVLSLPDRIGAATFLVVSRDVSELHDMLERERDFAAGERVAREEAARATAQRDELLARVSHQIRTPLNNILACAVLLQGDHSAATRAIGREIQVLASGQAALVDRLTGTDRERAASVPAPAVECAPSAADPIAREDQSTNLTGMDLTLVLADAGIEKAVMDALGAFGARVSGASESEGGRPFDGVVVDVEDARAVAWLEDRKAQRGAEAFWSIAVTSDGSASTHEALRTQGFVEVVTRPIVVRHLAARAARAQRIFQQRRLT